MQAANVVPETSQQLLLHLDSPLLGSIKNDRRVMVFNFFSLCKERVTELPAYDDGQVRIKVTGTKHGVATIWDKELLIYLASLIMAKINRGEPVGRRLSFTAHDYFRACCVDPGGASYQRIKEALQRLASTFVETDIATGGEGEERGFAWITDYKLEYRRGEGGERRLKSVTVEICDWLYRAVCKDQLVLTYDVGYFKLGPLEKRLYEIARAHCGQQAGFRIGIEKLRTRVGSDMPLKTFKQRLANIVRQEKSPLPGYAMLLVDSQRVDRVARTIPTRVPLKRLQVYFFPTTFLATQSDKSAVPSQVLLVDDY